MHSRPDNVIVLSIGPTWTLNQVKSLIDMTKEKTGTEPLMVVMSPDTLRAVQDVPGVDNVLEDMEGFDFCLMGVPGNTDKFLSTSDAATYTVGSDVYVVTPGSPLVVTQFKIEA